ncbi:MAG: hypothetical protein M1839_004154 [Geoglossum umbratile]|nr:MAG: hypothetical protein M1839_004154 [Geoglossum umbratile]
MPPALRYAPLVGLCLFLVGAASENHHHTVGFQPNPSRRGTLNIIENCLFTILACTWTIQHPNVPARGDSKFATFLRRCKWTLVNILAPEFLLAQAIDHRIWAYESVKYLKDNGINVLEEHSWWRSVFRCCGTRNKDLEASPQSGRTQVKLTVKHCYYGNMGGFVLQPDLRDHDDRTQTLEEIKKAEYPVTIDELVEYLKVKPKDSLEPSGDAEETIGKIGVSEDDIMDKDKADIFTRVIALLQICWLVFTVSTRKARHLATTQLEVITLAFAGCAFVTYCCRWDKPQHIRIAKGIPVQFEKSLKDIQHPLRFYDIMMHGSEPKGQRGLRLKNDIIRPKQTPPFDVLSLLTIVMVLIGCVHLLAWNFAFPTPAERILWRTASLVSIGLPVLLLLLSWIIPITFSRFLNSNHQNSVNDNARQFVLACITAMRAYDDTSPRELEELEKLELQDERPFDSVVESLDRWSDDDVHYGAIFRDCSLAKKHLGRLSKFIEKEEKEERGKYSSYLPDFEKQFDRLAKIILYQDGIDLNDSESNNSEKKAGGIIMPPPNSDPEFANVDRTNLFPRYTKRERSDNIRHTLLRYLSPSIGIIYAVSRCLVFSLAFSSFREMPDSVYETTWTRYIPILQ